MRLKTNDNQKLKGGTSTFGIYSTQSLLETV